MQNNQTKGMFICIISTDETQTGSKRYHMIIQQIIPSEVITVSTKTVRQPFRVYWDRGRIWALKTGIEAAANPEIIKKKGKRVLPPSEVSEPGDGWVASCSTDLYGLSSWAAAHEKHFRHRITV